MLSTQIWIVSKQATNSKLNEHSLGGNECEELTHSQPQPQGPKLTKRSQQSDKQSEQCSVPPKVPSLQILGLS